MSGGVTIGVPVYKGEAYVAEALSSIQAQSYEHWEAIVSFDGADAAGEAACEPFFADPRFTKVVQPERLGWIGHVTWLQAQVAGDYWYFHQQDDVVDPTYLELLVDHAERHPEAALVFCDLVPFGRIDGRFAQVPSVTGVTAFTRQMTLLREHCNGYAFRGVTRADAPREGGPAPRNDCADFGVDIAWVAGVALSGELHHVPLELYRKRYHDANTESAWWGWEREDRLAAWPVHCLDMLVQALRIGPTVPEARLLWLAGVERLTSHVATPFLPVDELTDTEREALLVDLLRRARESAVHDIRRVLDADWVEIEALSRSVFDAGRTAMVEITAFGPTSVRPGVPFNVQPDGSRRCGCRRRAAPFPRSASASPAGDCGRSAPAPSTQRSSRTS